MKKITIRSNHNAMEKNACQDSNYIVINGHNRTGHTTYTRNNMGQKCEGNCGLWVLSKIIKQYIS